MIQDLRRPLDEAAERAGWAAGEIRTKMFRHTYCAARLQTAEKVRVGADAEGRQRFEWGSVSLYTVGREMGHGGDSMVKRVYAHLGTVPHRSPVVEYRWEQHEHKIADRLSALRANDY